VLEGVLRLRPEYRPVRRWYVGEPVWRPSRNFDPDSLTGWRMKPHHTFAERNGGAPIVYTSNAQGMRAPRDFSENCGSRPIVLLGDSFFFGTGVSFDETVGAQLEDSLVHAVDIYDLAMPGFGIDQMWMTLRHRALRLCPALLIVGFIDDDWRRSLTAHRPLGGMPKPVFVLDHDSLRRQTPADRPGPLMRFIRQHSSVWRVLELASQRLSYRAGNGEWWRVNRALLAAMANDAAMARVPILFVRLPARDIPPAFPALRDEMARIHVSYIDLADRSVVPAAIHLEGDAHLNARGHAWVAGKILEWIRSDGPAGLSGTPEPTESASPAAGQVSRCLSRTFRGDVDQVLTV
jgi:hypothetical protein